MITTAPQGACDPTTGALLPTYPVKRGWEEVAELYTLIGDRCFIAGGFAVWMASPQDDPYPANDIDIFAVTPDHAWAITQEICALYGWDYSVSPVAFSLHPSPTRQAKVVNKRRVQVVIPNPKWDLASLSRPYQMGRVLDGFDLDVCRGVLVSPEIVSGDPNMGGYDAHLRVIRNPVYTLRRMFKYMQKGVRFSDIELFNVLWYLHSLQHSTRKQFADLYFNNPDNTSWTTPRYELDDRWFVDYTLFQDMDGFNNAVESDIAF